MSLVNVAYSAALTWSNPQMKELEEQALVPMFGDHPVELGLREGDGFLPMLRSDAKYRELFERAFPETAERFTIANVTKAIASFERSIISARSPYDRYHYGGDDNAVSEAAKRGEILFFNQHLSCFRCHGGFNFSDATVSEGHAAGIRIPQYRALQCFRVRCLSRAERGYLRVHEGSEGCGKIQSAHAAQHCAHRALHARRQHRDPRRGAGSLRCRGQDHPSGPHAGVGHDNPNKDPLIGGFELSSQDRKDLIEFLKSLTDEAVLHDPRFANPW